MGSTSFAVCVSAMVLAFLGAGSCLSSGEIAAVAEFIRLNPQVNFAGLNASLACERTEFSSIFGCNNNKSIASLCVICIHIPSTQGNGTEVFMLILIELL